MGTINFAYKQFVSAKTPSEIIIAYETLLELHEQTLANIETYAYSLSSKNTTISTKTVAEKLQQILDDHKYGTS